MSGVATRPVPHGNRLGGLFVEESSETERHLCSMVETAVRASTSALQKVASDPDKRTVFKRAGVHFQTHDIRMASDGSSDHTFSRAFPNELFSELQAQLESCCSLLRQVDRERRQMRTQCIYLQKEHELRCAELGTLHRYSTEVHQRSLTLDRQVLEERQRRKQLENEMEHQTQEVMHLRRFLRSIPHNVLVSLSSTNPADGALVEVLKTFAPDRRFEEAFRDKMKGIVYKRRYRQTRTMHQLASENLETMMMEKEDELQPPSQSYFLSEEMRGKVLQNVPMTTQERLLSSSDISSAVEDPLSAAGESHIGNPSSASGVSTLTSRTNIHSLLSFPFQLSFTTASPNDAHIKYLIHHSAYAEPLNQLRDHVLRLSSRLKVTQDTGLGELYSTFIHVLSFSRSLPAETKWRSLYERQLQKMQRAHRDLLYGVIEQVNMAATRIPEIESGDTSDVARLKLVGGVPLRRDIGCTAQESTTMEEYRSSQLREQLEYLKLHSLEAAAAAQKESEEMSKQLSTARLSTLHALQSLRTVAKSVVTAVQLQEFVSEAVSDPFAQLPDPVSEEVLDDPRLTTKTAEATESVISYLDILVRSGGKGNRGKGAQRLRLGSTEAPFSSRASGGDRVREDALENSIDTARTTFDATATSISSGKEFSRRVSVSSGVGPISISARRSSTSRSGRRLSAPQLPPMKNGAECIEKPKTSGGRRNSCAVAPLQYRPARKGNPESTAILSEPIPRDTMGSQKNRINGRDRKRQEVVAVVELGFVGKRTKQ